MHVNGLLSLLVGSWLILAPPWAWSDTDPVAGEDEDPFAEFEDEDWEDPWATDAGGLTWTGFFEGGLGARSEDVENLDRLTLGELRVRAETSYQRGEFRGDFKGELLYDHVPESVDLLVRELAVSFRPGQAVDAKLGRQVLTWGTGDLLFLNDLFPKDFISFFAGRDEDYLKSPSDTARITVFTPHVNVDLAYTPHFTPDDYLFGERFAFWNPALGEVAAPADPRRAEEPTNGELAMRLFRTRGATEYALYGYHGRWKQPVGIGADGQPRFPRLRTFGGSVRLPLHKGLFNAEAAWYDSRDDRSGDDPRTPNSELRLLAGYEQELVRNLTAGTQLYAERIQHHDRLLAASSDPARERDQWRSVATLRLTHRALRDTLTSSLFLFASPSDEDLYLRPSVAWRRDDHWLFAAGLNLFHGRNEYTFFGQLEDNSNGWVRLRYYY
jgi:hypothetical protein